MGRWVRLAEARDISPGTGRAIQAEGRWFALFNVDGEFFAIDDTCPHQGASLGEGLLHEGRVICPWHSWVFDVRTGACPRIPDISVATFPVRRVGEAVEVEIPDESAGGETHAGEAAS